MTDSIRLQKDLGERQWQKWVVYVDRVCLWFTFVFWMYRLPPDPECVFKVLCLFLEKDENYL